MERRRYLLSIIASAFKWLAYKFNYLYNSIVPTSVSGKQVLNKARLKTIEGNSVVENQLIANPTFSSSSGYNAYNGTFSVSSNVGTFTATAQTGRLECEFGGVVANHSYLAFFVAKSSINNYGLISNWYGGNPTTNYSLSTTYKTFATIISNTSTASTWQFRIADMHASGFATIDFKSICIVDLTQMFPFDTPTTLTDNRVQALINRGTIPYNVGEIKNSVVSEISSKDSNDTTIGTISLPAPLETAGVGTAHNTFEVLKDSYRFTRNVFTVDLGTLDYVISSYQRFSAIISNMKTGEARTTLMLCPIYQSLVNGEPFDQNWNMVIYNGANNDYVLIHNTSYSSASTFKTAMSGVPLTYELATPQVINIPKKHLGAVDLGNIGLTLSGGFWRGIVSNIKSPSATTMPNIYCSKYMNDTYAHLQSNGYIAISDNGYVYIKDSTKTQASDFNGIILFFETNAETTDFANETNVESGGTLNSVWFSWVENQLSPQSGEISGKGLTVLRNGGTFTVNGTSTGATHYIDNNISFISSHVYLVYAKVKNYPTSSNTSAGMQVYGDNIISKQVNVFFFPANGVVSMIATATGTGNGSFRFRTSSGISYSNTEVMPQLIDLTVGFPDGNVPTNVNDPIVQKIIQLGYIPTNITGTNKSITSEVLPNAVMELKCK